MSLILNNENFVIKSTAAVHISTPLTKLQKQMFNILLNCAQSNIINNSEYKHEISLKEMMQKLGYADSTNYDSNIKDSLLDFARISIQWNVLGKRKNFGVAAAPLLSGIEIVNGKIMYTFSPILQGEFLKPILYAQLNLDIQKIFKFKTSIILWEFLCEDLSTKKSNFVFTEWFKLVDLSKILCIVDEKDYSYIKRKLLVPSVAEINDVSDIEIVLNEKKAARGKVTHVRFSARRKSPFVISVENNNSEQDDLSDIKNRLLSAGFTKNYVEFLTKKYSQFQIEKALDVYNNYKNDGYVIKNPTAYIKKAIEEDWNYSKTVENQKKDEIIFEKFDLTSKIEESEECFLIRKQIAKNLGHQTYKDWIENSEFCVKDDVLYIYVDSLFLERTINQEYLSKIQNIAKDFLLLDAKCGMKKTALDI